MIIKDVEQRTGITKQNIRFYEKQGLLSPHHSPENGYREYSEEDVTILNEIKLFRKLGISIEDISKVQLKEITINDCMKKYSQITITKIEEMKKQKQFFDKILSDHTEFDVKKYLADVEQEEENGTKFFNITFDFITKAKNYLGKGVEDMFIKKAFDIELDDALTYPTSQTICSYVEKYCIRSKVQPEFVSKESPVTFYINKDLYGVEIRMARGGYMILCKQI